MEQLYPRKKSELICGLVYLPLHIFVMPVAVSVALHTFFTVSSDAVLTLTYYLIGFLFLIICMRGFLKDSFSDFIDSFVPAMQSVLLSYLIYILLLYGVSILLAVIKVQLPENPNGTEITAQIAQNRWAMIVSTLLLAPIVEETLFRGVLFGLVRKASRVAAYVASFLLFSVYHLIAYLAAGFDVRIIFCMLQYLPGAVALAACYERSGTIWAPVILHIIINAMATL